MRIISLVPIGEVAQEQLKSLADGLASRLRVACATNSEALDVAFAFNPLRRQYDSTEILKRLGQHASRENWRVLGVTEADIYIPIMTYVFGEAQLRGCCAVVSSYRLREEFYGMPPNPGLLAERLLKEALHELGHTLGLRHCCDYRCVMGFSSTVESIDLKLAEFCPTCARLAVAA